MRCPVEDSLNHHLAEIDRYEADERTHELITEHVITYHPDWARYERLSLDPDASRWSRDRAGWKLLNMHRSAVMAATEAMGEDLVCPRCRHGVEWAFGCCYHCGLTWMTWEYTRPSWLDPEC